VHPFQVRLENLAERIVLLSEKGEAQPRAAENAYLAGKP
jgi:hypothetical protein